jgi:outer membrane protein OmpA-like peptidoglycan-associated protein
MRRFFAVLGPAAVLLIFAGLTAQAVAKPIAVERRLRHPDGATLTVRTIELHDDSIVLSVALGNQGDREIRLNQARSLVLTDDAHGIHYLNPPADNPELRVAPRAQSTGELVFIGPLAAAAHQLKLSTNDGIGTPDNPHDDAPLLSAIMPLGGESDAGGQFQANHSDGAALRVRRFQTGAGGCVISLLATNGNDRPIRLSERGSLQLSDERGGSTSLQPAPGNADLTVPSGHRLVADLVFPCWKVDLGGPVTLTTNHGLGTPDNPYETAPVLTLRLRAQQIAGAPTPVSSQAATTPIARSHLTSSAMIAVAAAPGATPPAEAPPEMPLRSSPPPEAKPTPAPAIPLADDKPLTDKPPADKPQAKPGAQPALQSTKTERGQRVVLSADELFGTTGDVLAAAAEPLLARLNEAIAASHPREIVIAGHTDAGSNDDEDQALSERRAHAVAAWLHEHAGKSRARLVEKSYGRTRPVAPNHNADGSDNPDGRAKNRRIEVLLLR